MAVGFQILPYARALREVSEGANLCNPLVARTPDREGSYSWVAPTRRLLVSAFVLRGAIDTRLDPAIGLGDSYEAVRPVPRQ